MGYKIMTYSLYDTFALTCPGNRALSIRMDKLSHSSRTYEQRHATIDAENFCSRIHGSNVSEDVRSKPDPVEARFIRIASDEIGRGAGIKCPRLFACRLGRHKLEIV